MVAYTVDRLNKCLAFAGLSELTSSQAGERTLKGCTRLAVEIARLENHYGIESVADHQIGQRLIAVETFQMGIKEL